MSPVPPQFLRNSETFQPIDHASLTETVQNLKSTTCCLDMMPTSLLKSVFNCVSSDVLKIVNASLLSGEFPRALKTVVIKPLLKKLNLDASVIRNYRSLRELSINRFTLS